MKKSIVKSSKNIKKLNPKKKSRSKKLKFSIFPLTFKQIVSSLIILGIFLTVASYLGQRAKVRQVEASSTPKLIKVYRLNNVVGTSDQITTTSKPVVDYLVASNAWVEQQVNWADYSIDDNKSWVYDRQIPGTIPIYCLENTSQSIHTITSSATERASLIGTTKWKDYKGCGINPSAGTESNILGYGFMEQTPGSIPLYQLYKQINTSGTNTPGPASHMLTTTLESIKSSLSLNNTYISYGTGVKTPYDYASPKGVIAYVLRYDHINTQSAANSQPYYEINYPSGTFLNTAPKGIMMVVHGGGWIAGDSPVHAIQPLPRNEAKNWSDIGWQTINIDYHPSKGALSSVLQTYSRIKAWKPLAKKCVLGTSAGAQLALMTAANNSDVVCAVSHGGPLDLPGLLPSSVKNAAVAVFCSTGTNFDNQSCKDELAAVSPKQKGQVTAAKVLVAANVTDTVVVNPVQQLDLYKTGRAGRQAWIAKLNSGTNLYTHKNIDDVSKNLIYNTTNGLYKRLSDCVLGVSGASNCFANIVFTP
ncbi:MAG: hypothetical protein AAB459_00230 [Patescibacteria group bacterium]